MVNLGSRAMIVAFSASQWTARKYDKNASAEVAQNHGANNDAGRYNKQLIAKKEIQKIEQIVGEARRYTDANTLPWNDQGGRILSVDNYFDYTEGMRLRREKFEAAIDVFSQNYPSLIEQAKIELNGLFNDADYPPVAKIRNRFDWRVSVFPLPQAGDFRVNLEADVVASVQKDIESRVTNIMEDAQKDLWNRLYKVVRHMADTLGDPEKNKFHDTLVGNIIDVCKLLPKLNITQDPKLEQMRVEVESKLTGWDSKTLKTDKKVRKDTAQTANSILATMASFMGGTDATTDAPAQESDEGAFNAAA